MTRYGCCAGANLAGCSASAKTAVRRPSLRNPSMSYEFGPPGAVVARNRNLPDQLERPVLLTITTVPRMPPGQSSSLAQQFGSLAPAPFTARFPDRTAPLALQLGANFNQPAATDLTRLSPRRIAVLTKALGLTCLNGCTTDVGKLTFFHLSQSAE